MTLDEMLGRIYASMPDIGTMADPIKRNPIVQNIARNVGEVRDFAAGRSELYPSAPVEQYMAGVRRPVGPQAGMMDQAMDLVNPLARMGLIGMVNRLPMNESARMQRARKMGFDVDRSLYHGTASDISEFSPGKFGSSTGAKSAESGVWSVDSPGTARGYAEYAGTDAPVRRLLKKADDAEKTGNWDAYDARLVEAEKLEAANRNKYGQGQNIMPVSVRGRYLERDMGGAEFTDVQDEIHGIIKEAREGGYDGIDLANLADDPGFSGRPARHVLTFDPKNIRSKFAAFDPDKSESAKIIAGAGGLALGTAAYLGQEEGTW